MLQLIFNFIAITTLAVISICIVICTVITILAYKMDKKEMEGKLVKEIEEIISSHWGD